MLSFLPKTPSDIQQNLKTNFKQKRKKLGFTQNDLADRSGVSLGSLKRFENKGQISLESLLKLALVLECLEEFRALCKVMEVMPDSIEDLL